MEGGASMPSNKRSLFKYFQGENRRIDKLVTEIINDLKHQVIEYPTYKTEKPNIVNAIGNVQFLLRLFLDPQMQALLSDPENFRHDSKQTITLTNNATDNSITLPLGKALIENFYQYLNRHIMALPLSKPYAKDTAADADEEQQAAARIKAWQAFIESHSDAGLLYPKRKKKRFYGSESKSSREDNLYAELKAQCSREDFLLMGDNIDIICQRLKYRLHSANRIFYKVDTGLKLLVNLNEEVKGKSLIAYRNYSGEDFKLLSSGVFYHDMCDPGHFNAIHLLKFIDAIEKSANSIDNKKKYLKYIWHVVKQLECRFLADNKQNLQSRESNYYPLLTEYFSYQYVSANAIHSCTPPIEAIIKFQRLHRKISHDERLTDMIYLISDDSETKETNQGKTKLISLNNGGGGESKQSNPQVKLASITQKHFSLLRHSVKKSENAREISRNGFLKPSSQLPDRFKHNGISDKGDIACNDQYVISFSLSASENPIINPALSVEIPLPDDAFVLFKLCDWGVSTEAMDIPVASNKIQAISAQWEIKQNTYAGRFNNAILTITIEADDGKEKMEIQFNADESNCISRFHKAKRRAIRLVHKAWNDLHDFAMNHEVRLAPETMEKFINVFFNYTEIGLFRWVDIYDSETNIQVYKEHLWRYTKKLQVKLCLQDIQTYLPFVHDNVKKTLCKDHLNKVEALLKNDPKSIYHLQADDAVKICLKNPKKYLPYTNQTISKRVITQLSQFQRQTLDKLLKSNPNYIIHLKPFQQVNLLSKFENFKRHLRYINKTMRGKLIIQWHQSHPKILYELLESNPSYIIDLEPDQQKILLSHKETLERYLSRIGKENKILLCSILAKYCPDIETAKFLISQTLESIQHLPIIIRRDEEIITFCLKIKPETFKHFPKIQKDKIFILHAIKQNGNLIKWVSEKLKNDPEVVAAAILQNKAIFEDYRLSKTLIKSEAFIKKIIDKPGILEKVIEELEGDIDFDLFTPQFQLAIAPKLKAIDTERKKKDPNKQEPPAYRVMIFKAENILKKTQQPTLETNQCQVCRIM